MRTSLNEIRRIEQSIEESRLNPEMNIVWRAQLLADPELSQKVKWQQKVRKVILFFGRRTLKKELNQLHSELMARSESSSFEDKIRGIFPTF